MRSVRSDADLQKAKKCAELLYGGNKSIDYSALMDVLDELPLSRFSKAEMAGKTVADLLVFLHIAQSKSSSSILNMSTRGC